MKKKALFLPLSLYSRGSSFLDFILNADDAREPAANSGLLEEEESLSMPFATIGLAFSSPTIKLAPPPLWAAALLTNGLRKGGMAWEKNVFVCRQKKIRCD